MRCRYNPGTVKTLLADFDAIQVQTDSGVDVGSIGRGRLDGGEKVGTFRFEPTAGPPTVLGIASFKGSWIKRLLRPDYLVLAEERQYRLRDTLGENLLYFAVSGELDDKEYLARQDWDDSVEVRVDGVPAARWDVGGLSGEVGIDITAPGPIEDPHGTLFGVTMLMPLMYLIYRDESSLIETLLG